MYWPVGAPRSFAQQLPTHLTSTSQDGIVDHGGTTGKPSVQSSRSSGSEHELLAQNTNGDNVVSNDRHSAEGYHLNDEEQAHKESYENAPRTVTDDGELIALRVARNGQLFATITKTMVSLWQTEPTAVLASLVRSETSLQKYGTNVGLLLRPDADVVVLSTSLGYLITYAVGIHPEYRAYRLRYEDGDKRHARRRSVDHARGFADRGQSSILDGAGLGPDVSLEFTMAYHFDSRISRALALESELIVATSQPAAIQCIRWTANGDEAQGNTELLARMEWMNSDTQLDEIVYDRPMNLYAFIAGDGHAYAVQRLHGDQQDSKKHKSLFSGYCFHKPRHSDEYAVKAAINSRFSLVAVGCADGSIWLYAIRDYTGGITLLRRIESPATRSSSRAPTSLAYSPDGYCLFVGYLTGWMTCSVYGQPGASSFSSTPSMSHRTGDEWLLGASDAFWASGGSDIIMLDHKSHQLWIIEFARSAVTGCFTPANVSKAILQINGGFMVYRGHQMPDLLTPAADVSLWQHVKAPASYVDEQWPLRATVVSPDGRYLAIAGQRGLAHYSFTSGRWKTFDDPAEQEDFSMRGGMCWHHHILIVATESSDSTHELRLYSRETALTSSAILHSQTLDAPVVHLSPSGDDSILVYTHDNVLDHYIVAASKNSVRLVKVGQIALNGIIRAPSRVRSVSWIVSDDQLRGGEPAQDVVVASVIFLVDGKLVLLQPSTSDDGGLKYDMRMIAQRVEWYTLARDSHAPNKLRPQTQRPDDMSNEADEADASDYSLGDSLWVYDGQEVRIWPDVHDLISKASNDSSRDICAPISIPVDFYPLSALLQKGVLFGVEAEIAQRRDASFSLFRAVARTSLYLPKVLQYHLSQFNSPAALHLSHHHRSLPYFAHALEILLHNVLDEEVESPPSKQEDALLPAVLAFLSTFPEYLEIIVQCARKTELRSWRTLFQHLPPPIQLFEMSMERGSLKTAGGYLLVLHNLEDVMSTSPQVIRLLRAARAAEDWDLCKELARFLMALDESGDTLREALERIDVVSPVLSRRPSGVREVVLGRSGMVGMGGGVGD